MKLDPRLGFHPEAVAEARGAARWYRERNPDAAEAFLTEFERALLRIAEQSVEIRRALESSDRFEEGASLVCRQR